MKIGIIPSIKELYKDQYEYTCDIRLVKFVKKIFKNHSTNILNHETKINKEYKLIIISGGNNLYNFSSKKKIDTIRIRLNEKFYRMSIKYKIPILGICFGAQYLASKFNSTFKRKKHTKNHFVKIVGMKKLLLVNSYHNIIISRLGNNLLNKGFSVGDNSIELFSHPKKKLLGMMWHPERYKKNKLIDIKLIKDLVCT
jgi:putative glutamine amidotransferase